MSYGLNNVSGTDDYSDGNTLTFARAVRVTMVFQNAPIYYQLQQYTGQGESVETGNWFPERYLPCASGQTVMVSLDRLCTGFRFRNAVVGDVVAMSCECLDSGEVP